MVNIDEIMGFDPANLSIFNQSSSSGSDPNIYKTNPKDSVSDDGIYRSKVRILMNPFNPKESIVPQSSYWLASADGSRAVRSSLSIGDKNCPIFKAWKRHHFSKDPDRDAFAKSVFNKSERMFVLVQILEDENQPNLVGSFRIMKLPKDIYNKLADKLNPSEASGKKPYPAMDSLFGLELDITVTPGPDDPTQPSRKQREISYSLSQFGDYAPIIQTSGDSFLDDDEIALVDEYMSAYKDSINTKVKKKQEDGKKKMIELRDQIQTIHNRAQEYIKENTKNVTTGESLDVSIYCGYQPWDEETKTFVSRWIEMADEMIDPQNMMYSEFLKKYKNGSGEILSPVSSADDESSTITDVEKSDDNDLPF